MSEIVVSNLRYAYEKEEILKEVSFSAKSGEYVYILGPNGVGKSTLFRCMMGHLKNTDGEIEIDHKRITDYKVKELAKKVAYISQSCHPTFNYSVLELAMMGRTAHLSTFATPTKREYEITYEVLKRLEIEDKAEQGILEVSGGEKQLAMIARALVQEAEILLMDEPTSNLDYGNQLRIQAQMKKLAQEGILVIQSSHNPQHAMIFGDKVVALNEGKVVACGKPKEVITAKLLHKLYGIETEIKENLIIPKVFC